MRLEIIFIVLWFGWHIVSVVSATQSNEFLVVGGYIPEDPYILGRYIVSVRAKNEDAYGMGHFCAGVIVTETAIVTAAHCLIDFPTFRKKSARKIIVAVGSVNRLVESADSAVYEAMFVVFHKEFGYEGFANDIGMIRTKRRIIWKPGRVEKVPLVQKPVEQGMKCTAVGWGRMWELGPVPNELLFVDLQLWDKDECDFSLPGFDVDTMVCASSVESKGDTCQGDSGGPLFCDGYFAGIVSFGSGCGYAESPGAYTDVFKFLRWIEENKSTRFVANSLIYLNILFIYLINYF